MRTTKRIFSKLFQSPRSLRRFRIIRTIFNRTIVSVIVGTSLVGVYLISDTTMAEAEAETKPETEPEPLTPNMNPDDLFTPEELDACPLALNKVFINNTRDCVFWIAVELGKTDLVIKMLEAGFEPDTYDNTALEIACRKQNVELVQILLADPRVDPTEPYTEILYLNSRTGMNEQIERLLRANSRFDPNLVFDTIKKKTPSKTWNPRKKESVIELLFSDSRFNLYADNDAAVIYATEHGYTDLVRKIIQDPMIMHGSNMDAVMQEALRHNHQDIVQMLLSETLLYDNIDVFGWALFTPYVQMQKFIVDNCELDDYNLALGLAVASNQPSLVKNLLDRSKINGGDIMDALELSMRFDNNDIFEILSNDKRVNPVELMTRVMGQLLDVLDLEHEDLYNE